MNKLDALIDFWKEASVRNMLACFGLTTKHVGGGAFVTGVQITKSEGKPLILDVQLKSGIHEPLSIRRFVLRAGEWYEEGNVLYDAN